MDPRLETMVEAARAGGAVALAHYRRGVQVSLKADRSPVTEADRTAERAITEVLLSRFGDHGVLGEELGEAGPRERRFIIDPIDGTRNFVRGIPTWASLRTQTYQYIEYYEKDNRTIKFREYYDLTTDPWELENVLADAEPANDPDVAALSAQIQQASTCAGTTGANPCP